MLEKRTTLLVLLFACLSGTSFAGVWSTDYDTARAESKKTGRPMMVLFTGSDWCPYCIALEKEIFKKPEFATWAATAVIPVMCDQPRRSKLSKKLDSQNKALMNKFGVKGFPAVLFISSDEKVLGKSGYLKGYGAKKWTDNADMIMAAAGVVPGSGAAASADGSRVWTDRSGRTVTGVLYSNGAGSVKIRTDDKGIVTVRFDDLSDADQAVLNGK